MTREVARKFNQVYCGVDPHAEDKDHLAAGGVFPVIQPKLGRVKRLVGTGAPSPETGQLLKMSKSLNNAIFLSDRSEEHTSELQSLAYLVCRLLLEKKKKKKNKEYDTIHK